MTEVDLTNEAYSRWLRAGRPQPITWYLCIHPEEQETLAILGDEHNQDLAVAVGYAINDPELADASLDADENPDSQETILRRLAEMTAANRDPVYEPAPPPEHETLTMGGGSKRQEAKEVARTKTVQDAKDKGRNFLGKKPSEYPCAFPTEPQNERKTEGTG